MLKYWIMVIFIVKNKHSIINANAKFWYDNDYFKITKSLKLLKIT